MMNNLDPSLVNQCFEFVQSMAAQKVGHFSLKLTIGQSQFFFDSRENTSARTPPVEVRQTHKTPSKMRRNARRREQFLRKKLTSPTSPATADSELSRSGGGQSEKEASGSGDKISRLKSREEGRKISYLTRRISALAQQTELNQRCIGVLTSWQPFDSRKMAEYGIEEDYLECDKPPNDDYFRLTPGKCGFKEPSQDGKEADKDAMEEATQTRCLMCYKAMTADHQC